MPSLRRRFLSGTRVLLGLQILTSGLVLASWLSVVRVSDGLRDLSALRARFGNGLDHGMTFNRLQSLQLALQQLGAAPREGNGGHG